MKKKKRIGHKLGILFIIGGTGYAFIRESIKTERIETAILFLIMSLFVFAGYWRLYQYYKIEKLWQQHNRIDFVDYVDNMPIYQFIKLILPFPMLKRLENKKENKIKRAINLSTLMYYLLGISFFILAIGKYQ